MNSSALNSTLESFIWVPHERWSVMRLPTSDLSVPDPAEVRKLFWHDKIAIITFSRKPDLESRANAWLYVNRDKNYNQDKLPPPARRALRRALATLRFAPLTIEQVQTHGLAAYQDTRSRIGLADVVTAASFSRGMAGVSRLPAHQFMGAWNGGELAAFMILVVLRSRVDIIGSYFATAHQASRPMDGLVHHVFSEFLIEKDFDEVSFGCSSIQEESGAAGLHYFKTKVGFQAEPIHRAFLFHPFVRPFLNRPTHLMLRTVLKAFPGNRKLKKASGVMAAMLNDTKLSAPPLHAKPSE